jgi:hypothetical protein
MRIVIFGLRLGLGIGVSRHRGEAAVLGGRIGSVLLCFPHISPCHITLLLAVSCRPSTVGAMTFADPQSSSGLESEAFRQAVALTSKDNNAVSATALRREPEPSGNASLRADPWKALTRAEIEAFNAMPRDQVRRVREAAGDAAWQRYAERPFPGGPLSPGLTSREAAELSGKLERGWQALWDTKPGAGEWDTPEAGAHAGAMREIEATLDDVEAETIVAGLREPLETIAEFRQRTAREAGRVADAAAFSGLREPSPEAGFEMDV